MRAHPDVISAEQAAKVLGVSSRALRAWIDQGRIAASTTLGGHRRITFAELDRVAEEMGLTLAQESPDE